MMLSFLKAILPGEGLYCVAAFDAETGLKKQEFVKTLEALAERIAYWDKRLEGTKGNVYHGCASYLGTTRVKQSVKSLRSLWMELDIGPDGHKSGDNNYPDIATALGAIKSFIDAYGLPVPLVVNSGHGLHCYWPLSELAPASWDTFALGLKAACEEFGLRADPQRTADASSILRTPGTRNRKCLPTVEVAAGPIVGPYPLEAFHVLHELGQRIGRLRSAPSGLRHGEGSGLPRGIGPRPRYLGAPHRPLLEAVSNVTIPETVDVEALVGNCAQLRAFRDRRGNIPEPLWYAGLGVLGFISGGERLAHEWSSGHPRYTISETNGRLARIKLLSGPTRCERFRELAPDVCRGCMVSGETPLGSAKRKAVPPPPPSEQDDGDRVNEYPLAEHPEYKYLENALHFVQENNGKPVYTKITNFPVSVQSIHTGEIKRDQNYYLLRHYKPHQGWKEIEFRASQMAAESIVPTMADVGVVVHHKILFLQYIRDSVDAISKRRAAGMSYEQFGWKGKDFLFGDKLYSYGKTDATSISQELRFRSQWLKPVEGGSVQGWKDAVDCLMGKGSEGMSFTILASFASVLMRFLEENEGGAVINLMTRHSGAGKTTSLSGAYTVWASDVRALGLTTIDTKVSKSVSLGVLGNLPAIYDEFHNKDPAIVREFIIMFTSGRDKMRADATGGLIHAAASWQMLLLSASNQSIRDAILSTGESDAPAMRVLEMPIESSGDLSLSEATKLAKALHANAGWAGDAYLRYLVQPNVIEQVRDLLPATIDEVMTTCSFRKEHRFWARTLAAVAVAAKIVEHLGLISFSPQRIMAWAFDHFAKATSTVYNETSLLGHLAQFLGERLDETLKMPSASKGRLMVVPIGDIPQRRISIRIEVDTWTCYVSEFAFRQWLERNGGGYSALMREMKEIGMLKMEHKPVTLGAGSGLYTGQVYCFAFDLSAVAFSGTFKEVKDDIEHDRKIMRLQARL